MPTIIPPEELNVFKAIAAKEANDNKDKKENDIMQNNTNLNNAIQTFTNNTYGNIRVVMIDGEPWMVGKDAATMLGYAKPENAIATHVDEEDKTTTLIQGTGSNYKSKAVIINESGFYALVFGSKLPTARAIKRWVTSEVLPSIRKTGSYSTQLGSYQIDDPIARAERWIEEQREKQAALLALEEAKPKVETYDKLISYKGYVGLREMAKMLGYPLNKMGAFVCEIGMCYKENGIYYPYAKFSSNGMCVGKWHRAKWSSHGGMKTVFSLEGVEYVRKALKRIGWKPNKK
jgi:prophage antirepressor-like protein